MSTNNNKKNVEKAENVEIRWPTSGVFKDVESGFDEHLREAMNQKIKEQFTDKQKQETQLKRFKGKKLHNLMTTNLRQLMCKLCPRTENDLKYYLSGKGLKKHVKRDYGDSILNYFNSYLLNHPDIALSGQHPSVGTIDSSEDEYESQYFVSSDRKKPKSSINGIKRKTCEPVNWINSKKLKSKYPKRNIDSMEIDDDDDDFEDEMMLEMMDKVENKRRTGSSSAIDLT